MKARIKETGEVVDVEYDDDDLYVVIGRRQYLYASEFDFITEPEEEVRIDGFVARDKDGSLNLFNGEPERIADCTWGIYPGDLGLGLPKEYFPDLKWESDPLKVTITIRPKKK